MACSSCTTSVRVAKGFWQVGDGQMMPLGVMVEREEGEARPSKMKACLQERQRRVRRAESLKRSSSGIWLSSGEISVVWLLVEEGAMEYFLVSRPRHSASCVASVPGIGAQSRSIGGKICLYRYHSTSAFRVEVAAMTSWGAKARFAALSEEGMPEEAEVVMM